MSQTGWRNGNEYEGFFRIETDSNKQQKDDAVFPVLEENQKTACPLMDVRPDHAASGAVPVRAALGLAHGL